MFAPHAVLLRVAATFALLAPAAPAGDWYVDAGYSNCSSSDGSAAKPYCTIDAAIAAASSGDTIHVAPGTYVGPITVDRSLTLIGTQGAAVTLLTGRNANAILSIASNLTVDASGFTFQNGRSQGTGGVGIGSSATVTFTDCAFRKNQNLDNTGEGGAVGAYQSTLLLQRCTLGSNSCGFDGAGIAVDGGSLTVLDCDFHDNLVGNSNLNAPSGAAIRAMYGATVDVERTRFSANGSSIGLGSFGAYGGAISSYQATVAVTDCTFSDNDAGDGQGGAIQGDGFTIVGCTFERNSAHEGGAVDASGVSIERCRFTANEATGINDHGGIGGLGGALVSRSGAVVADCVFEGNVAHGKSSIGAGGGGAFYGYAAAGTPSSFVRCRFAGNRAEGCDASGGSGGGLVVGSYVSLLDCEIVDCEAAGSTGVGTEAGNGGGAVVGGTAGISFTRCTIAGNRADNANGTAGSGGRGGGLYAGTAFDVDHCVVAGNFAQAATTQDVFGTVHSIGWNDFGDTGGATITGPGTNDLLDVDPVLLDPANGDFRLDPTSPCIDSGDPTLHPAGRDVAWNPRLLDGDLDGVLVLDRGAHEFDHVALSVTGSATPGGSLVLDTSGTTGLPVVLLVGGATAELDVRKFGACFVDLGAPFLILPFGTIPNTQNATLDPSLPVPLTVYLQEAAIAAGAGNLGNLVTLDVE